MPRSNVSSFLVQQYHPKVHKHFTWLHSTSRRDKLSESSCNTFYHVYSMHLPIHTCKLLSYYYRREHNTCPQTLMQLTFALHTDTNYTSGCSSVFVHRCVTTKGPHRVRACELATFRIKTFCLLTYCCSYVLKEVVIYYQHLDRVYCSWLSHIYICIYIHHEVIE